VTFCTFWRYRVLKIWHQRKMSDSNFVKYKNKILWKHKNFSTFSEDSTVWSDYFPMKKWLLPNFWITSYSNILLSLRVKQSLALSFSIYVSQVQIDFQISKFWNRLTKPVILSKISLMCYCRKCERFSTSFQNGNEETGERQHKMINESSIPTTDSSNSTAHTYDPSSSKLETL
jgi:hypothetical protein